MKMFLGGCAAAALLLGSAGESGAQSATFTGALSADEAAFFTAIGHHATDAAVAYEDYVRCAVAIDPRFSDPASVQHALRVGANYQAVQFQEGIVAFAAMVALRDQPFVDGVRAQGGSEWTERLTRNPQSVMSLPGAREAAADVTAVLRAHGAALRDAGKAITQAAYDVQHQAWSKQPVANPERVLADVEANAQQPRRADVVLEKALLSSLSDNPTAAAKPSESGFVRTLAAHPADADLDGAPSPQVLRGLALAALAILGRTGDAEDSRVSLLLSDSAIAECIKLAKMDLNQCLAAAGPHYDDVFCVGEHAVGETAKCVSSAADPGDGAPFTPQSLAANLAPPMPAPSPPPPDAPPPSETLQARYGPEEAAAYGYPAPGQAGGNDQSAAPAIQYPAPAPETVNAQYAALRTRDQAAGQPAPSAVADRPQTRREDDDRGDSSP